MPSMSMNKNINAIGKHFWRRLFYSMILFIASTKMLSVHYMRHPMSLFVRFAFPKSIFITQDRSKLILIKTMLKSFRLFSVLNYLQYGIVIKRVVTRHGL